jgi:hypothetical protein
VKPGGFLLIEDIEHNLLGDIGPGITKFYEVYHSYMKPRGVDAMTGPKLEPLLKESGVFSEVHTQKLAVPFSGKADGMTDHPALPYLNDANLNLYLHRSDSRRPWPGDEALVLSRIQGIRPKACRLRVDKRRTERLVPRGRRPFARPPRRNLLDLGAETGVVDVK